MKQTKTYEPNLKDKTEEVRSVKLDDGRTLELKYVHYPNVVGPRSEFKGLPIWVGKTEASGTLDGEIKTAEGKCWLFEPFEFERARVVCTGRILKSFGLPTSLAEQVKDKKD